MNYKHISIAFLLGIICFQTAQGQRMRERLKAQKVSFITEELALTPQEAQTFWPIYNEREAELMKLQKQMRKSGGNRSIESMSDSEVEALMEKRFKMEEDKIRLNRKYFKQMKKVIPIKKIARLVKAERQWKKQLVKRVKNRRKGKFNRE